MSHLVLLVILSGISILGMLIWMMLGNWKRVMVYMVTAIITLGLFFYLR